VAEGPLDSFPDHTDDVWAPRKVRRRRPTFSCPFVFNSWSVRNDFPGFIDEHMNSLLFKMMLQRLGSPVLDCVGSEIGQFFTARLSSARQFAPPRINPESLRVPAIDSRRARNVLCIGHESFVPKGQRLCTVTLALRAGVS